MPKRKASGGPPPRDPKKVQIGRRIAEARAGARLTQLQLAQRMGLQKSTISNWETGFSTPTFSNLRELARILGPQGEGIVPELESQKSPHELLGQQAIRHIGRRRLQHLMRIPQGRLQRELDAIIGAWMSDEEAAPNGS